MRFFPANYALFFGELCAQNPELCANYANCAIFLSEKLIHFQSENSKNAKKKGFLPPNPSGRFFLFLAVIGFFSSNHGACYIKSRAHAPNGQQHRTPGMPCLVERFSQGSGGYLLRKCTVFMEKNCHPSLKV